MERLVFLLVIDTKMNNVAQQQPPYGKGNWVRVVGKRLKLPRICIGIAFFGSKNFETHN